MTDIQKCQETRKLLACGAKLVDVRSAGEYSAGCLPDAINMPLQTMHRLHQEFDKETPLVVYCASGQRSRYAKSLLESAGFKAVHDLGSLQNIARC